MAKKKMGLVASAAATVMTTAMLVGATYAWFTEATYSLDNVITAGNLQVTMEHSKTVLGAEDEGWVDASAGAIFNHNNWEPGYASVRYIKIENEGSLDLKFRLNVIPNGAVPEGSANLADVIEVYMFDDAVTVSRSDLTTEGAAYVGTLSEMMNDPDGAAYGVLYAKGKEKLGASVQLRTIVLKMSEAAGNEYMGASVGGNGFAVQLLASQYSSESDDLGADFDAGSFFADCYVSDAEGLLEGLNGGEGTTVGMMKDVSMPAGQSNAYGKTALNINGQILDGNGKTISATDATGTWDSVINITAGTIKNLTVDKGFRGIFINHNNSVKGKVYLENVTVDGTTYTISCDQGTGNGLEAVNSTFRGWTSYAATIGNVKFVGCTFGEGAGYNFSRPYAPTEYVNCHFEAGHEIDPRAAVTFENCYFDGVLITADNLAQLVTSNIQNASVK